MKLIIFDIKTGKEIIDEKMLMQKANLDLTGCDFEDIGIQGDGTPIVCDKCGNFGAIDNVKVLIEF